VGIKSQGQQMPRAKPHFSMKKSEPKGFSIISLLLTRFSPHQIFYAMQLCQGSKERPSFFDHSQPDWPIQQGMGMKDIVRDMRIQQTWSLSGQDFGPSFLNIVAVNFLMKGQRLLSAILRYTMGV
jgi:hypothetical protein